jgi:hypothetical protein
MLKRLAMGLLLVLALTANAAASPDVAGTVIAMERAALDRSDRGDYDGYVEISAPDIVYIDPFLTRPIIGIADFTAYCKQADSGTAGAGKMLAPHVQLLDNAAVLTFNYDFTNGRTGKITHWNATEVYRHDASGWRIIQTHWSFTGNQKK